MTTARRMPSVQDLLLALGAGAVATAALAASPVLLPPAEAPAPGGPAWWVLAAGLWLQTAALLLARVRPRTVLVAVAAVAALVGLVAPTGIGNLADFAVIVAAVRTAAAGRTGPQAPSLLAAAVLVAIGQAADTAGSGDLPLLPAIGSGLVQGLVVVGVPAAVTSAVTARRDARRARDAELAAGLREREALVRAAVAGERTAMARELHDIAAHHLSSMALMTAAIDRQIDTDPAAAKAGVRQVRTQSRAMLDDLRRLVGLLRDGADEPDRVETLATVRELVESARAAGRAIELRRLGTEPRDVGPLAQFVGHRMVQESLANAAVHAPGAAVTVDLDGREAGEYVVSVRNAAPGAPAPGSSGGFGLVGMRERAELVGGALEAGPDGDGGWAVRLVLPRDRTAEDVP
ncbi:sensor histidine kinase [Amnibacterium setariae]|uniref:histidine kinase n=1 Tax=Amnibacterium setariae TaxID=2306585 RepID=A0A3A1TXR7_9MICO|nr:histidine kinase [Amnibacterium setariae]RIX28609.1 sensor histidine kinase [Amnibacterium setariae]